MRFLSEVACHNIYRTGLNTVAVSYLLRPNSQCVMPHGKSWNSNFFIKLLKIRLSAASCSPWNQTALLCTQILTVVFGELNFTRLHGQGQTCSGWHTDCPATGFLSGTYWRSREIRSCLTARRSLATRWNDTASRAVYWFPEHGQLTRRMSTAVIDQGCEFDEWGQIIAKDHSLGRSRNVRRTCDELDTTACEK